LSSWAVQSGTLREESWQRTKKERSASS
jgi:hypothetical protein